MLQVLFVWLVSVLAAFALVHWHDLALVATPFIALLLAAASPSLRFLVSRRREAWARPRKLRDDATIRLIVT